MSHRVRIIDIAKKAGVSKGTVDRVIHKRGNVSPDARKKVLKVMEDLDYQPNYIASALASNRQWKIAALIPDSKQDPFWIQPKEGMLKAYRSVRDYGVTVNIFNFRDADEEHFKSRAKKILEGNFDGLVIAPIYINESHAFLDECVKRGLKYIQINTLLPRDDDCFLGYVGQNSYHSGQLAAKLLDFGMQAADTAMVLHLEKEVYNAMHLIDKERGFEDFFKQHPEHDIRIVKSSFENVFDKRGLYRHLREEFTKNPEIKSLFVTTSKLFRIIPMLERLKMDHIKLVGFDLIEENLEYLESETIDFLINQNPHKQGFLSIINLFNHLVLKKEIKQTQFLPLDVVMQENVKYYLEEEQEIAVVI